MDTQPHTRFEDEGDKLGRTLARGLGWFSVGLGLAQLASPSRVARMIGVDDDGNEGLIRAIGVRELTSGFGLLAGGQTAPYLWSRVAGDAMDLTLLATALRTDHGKRDRIAAATAAVVVAVAAGATASEARHIVRGGGVAPPPRVD
jgi:hypothetical protein